MKKMLIHGHSCCEIRTLKSAFVCDPWLVGSAYWRSWWNFPELKENLLDELIGEWKDKENVFVYISHLHWDHFHGPSIRKIAREVKHSKFLIPYTPETRLKRDLASILPRHSQIRELDHAKKIKINTELQVVSFQSGPIAADSAIAIWVNEEPPILNLNDSKIFKNSLKHLLSLTGRPSCVLRSHSSANSRCCLRMPGPYRLVDKSKRDYSAEFLDSCYATGSPIAIPFASNMAHLHKDTFRYNSILNFADEVVSFYEENSISYPGMKCVQLLPGEQINLSDFQIENYRADLREDLASKPKQELLDIYRESKAAVLNRQYDKERQAEVKVRLVDKYFEGIMRETPFLLRCVLRDHVCIWADSDSVSVFFKLDFISQRIRHSSSQPYLREKDAIIKVSAYVINDVCAQAHWNSLGVSKRLTVLQSKPNKTFMLFGIVCASVEAGGVVALKNILKPRTLRAWLARRRELIDIALLFLAIVSSNKFIGKISR